MGNKNQNNVCVNFVADGKCKEFNFAFASFGIDNVDVYVNNKLEKKGYIVSKDNNAEGGKIVFENAPNVGNIVTIIRNLPIKRTTDFKEGGPFRASKVNMEFDYQLGCIEQLVEKLTRVICKPAYMFEDVNLDLPLPSPGKAIVWNQEGTSLKNSQISVENLADSVERAEELYKLSIEELPTLKLYYEKAELVANKMDTELVKKSNISLNNLDSIGEGKFNARANLSLSNVDGNIDYVIETWNSTDGLSFYRVYKNGWKEQGGVVTAPSTMAVSNFHIPFSNKEYKILASQRSSGSFWQTSSVARPLSATQFEHGVSSGNVSLLMSWFACGY